MPSILLWNNSSSYVFLSFFSRTCSRKANSNRFQTSKVVLLARKIEFSPLPLVFSLSLAWNPWVFRVAMPNNKYPKDLQITVVKLANGKRLGSRPRLVEICHRVAPHRPASNFRPNRFKRSPFHRHLDSNRDNIERIIQTFLGKNFLKIKE